MNNDEEKQRNVLIEKINSWRKDRYDAQRKWSGVHHFVLFGSIISSVFAGALIQIEKTEMATIFTTIAAVLTGIAASGGFERKWKSNRLSRSRADCLLLELDNEKTDVNLVREKLAAAIEKHDLEVVGEKNEDHGV
jgi:hypothetical protein